MKKFNISMFFILVMICLNVNAYTMTNKDCLTINLIKEAGSKKISKQDKVLVNAVVINRSTNGNYCKAVFQKGQFSWTKSYGRRTKFNSLNSMLSYYRVKDTDYDSKLSFINSTISESKKYNNVQYFHDNSIRNFTWNRKKGNGVRLAFHTSNFKFYRV